MFYLNSTLNFGIPPVLVFQLDVYYKVDRLLTGPTAQQKGATARWYSNKTSLPLNWNVNQAFYLVFGFWDLVFNEYTYTPLKLAQKSFRLEELNQSHIYLMVKLILIIRHWKQHWSLHPTCSQHEEEGCRRWHDGW